MGTFYQLLLVFAFLNAVEEERCGQPTCVCCLLFVAAAVSNEVQEERSGQQWRFFTKLLF